MADLFAPPTPEELAGTASNPQTDMFAPPRPEELANAKPSPAQDMFAPPTSQELASTAPAQKTSEGGYVVPARITKDEIANISKRHGVSEDELTHWASLKGGMLESNTPADLGRLAAGEAGEVVGAGLPQFAYKKTQPEATQKAFDELSTLVDQKKSTAQKGAEIAGSMLSSVGALKTVGKGAAKFAGEKLAPTITKAYNALSLPTAGAAAGLAHSETGKEVQGTTIGGAIGTIIPLAAKGLGTLARQGAEEASKYVLTQSQTVKHIIQDRLAEKVPEMSLTKDLLVGTKKLEELAPEELEMFLSKPLVNKIKESALEAGLDENKLLKLSADNNLKALKEGILKRTGEADFETLLRDAGPDKIKKLYDKDVGDKLITDLAKKGIEEGNYRPLSSIENIALKVMDAKPVYNIFDKRMGTQLSKSQDDASRKLVEADMAFAPEAQLAAKSAKTLNTEISKQIIDDIERGDLTSPQAQQWSSIFGSLRNKAESLGLRIPVRQNYVPQLRLPPEQYQAAIRSRAEDLGVDDLLAKGQNPVELFRTSSGRELLDEVSRALGGKEIKTADELRQGLTNIYADNGALLNRMNFAAASGKARDTQMPEFVRDTNLVSLFKRWTSGIKKEYALNDHFDEMARASKLAEKLGDSTTANYLNNHASHLSGETSDIFSETYKNYKTAVRNGLVKKAKEANTPIDRAFAEGQADLTDRLTNSSLINNMYANALSSPKAALQNYANPFLTAFGDQGAYLGTKLYLEANMDLAKILAHGTSIELKPHLAGMLGKQPGEILTTRDPRLIALNDGLIGKNWMRDLDPKQLENKRRLLLSAARNVNEGSNKALLAGFELSENAGRAITALMGRRLAGMIKAEPGLVDQVIKAPAYRTILKEMVAKGAPDNDLNQMVSQYLNSHSMLNFDKLNMSAYARSAGPLFRQFTKFPSFALGRAAQPFYDKGLKGGAADVAAAYLAPLAGFGLIDSLSGQKENPRLQKIFGKDGLKSWTLTSALSPYAETNFGIQKTPIVGTVMETGKTGKKILTNEDAETKTELYKWLGKQANTYAPGMGWLRLLAADIPAILENKAEDIDKDIPTPERRINYLLGK